MVAKCDNPQETSLSQYDIEKLRNHGDGSGDHFGIIDYLCKRNMVERCWMYEGIVSFEMAQIGNDVIVPIKLA